MQQMYSCPNCGAQVAFGVKFCPNCGTQFSWSTEQQMQPPPMYQQKQQHYDMGVGPRQKGTSPWIMAFIAIVAVGVLVGGAIIALGGFSEGTPPLPPPAASPPADSTSAADTTAPVITSVSVSSITETSATISWVTDEGATSQVEYGVATDYGSTSTFEQALVVSHSVTLTGLEPGTSYYCRVKSKDATGNEAVSGGDSFTTVTSAEWITPVGAVASGFTVWGDTWYTGAPELAIDGNDLTAWTLNDMGEIMFDLGSERVVGGIEAYWGGHVTNGNTVNVYVDDVRVLGNEQFGATRNTRYFAPVVGRFIKYETVAVPHNELLQVATWSEIAEFRVFVEAE